jgi:hypothetical protein
MGMRGYIGIAGVAIVFLILLGSCFQAWSRERAAWLKACIDDGNKPYQCEERWQRMSSGRSD